MLDLVEGNIENALKEQLESSRVVFIRRTNLRKLSN